ncbi:hypothetical protein Tco_0728108 [Tanacetum coccineum]|uniref:Retrotransposon gag domain-containing protein n=1 Tax=Tanacetum coccineum TaxID=301880 RepID=A0ABQ4YL23_9ASTR
MSKTRGDYGSGVTRPKINQDAHFKLKGQFLKELCDSTFSGLEHEDANEHIEKVLEIVDLFHISNITQDQIMLRAFLVSLTGAASRWLRNQPSGSITTWEALKMKPNLSLLLSSSNTNLTHPPPTTTSSQPPPPSHPSPATIQAAGNPHPAADHHHLSRRLLHHLSRHKSTKCKPLIPNNNEIDFRISFDESNDEDYTEPYGDLAETMIWYILKRTCVELIWAF